MADDKSLVDQAMDLFVYAPLGAALAARDQFPELAERGRQQVVNQVALARMIGQMAVSEGQRNAKRYAERVEQVIAGLNAQPSRDAASPPPPPPRPAPTNGKRDTGVGGTHLAIPGYDTLSASQIVQRLAGLNGEELEAVREYEQANRGRRTILSRVSQLQSA